MPVVRPAPTWIALALTAASGVGVLVGACRPRTSGASVSSVSAPALVHRVPKPLREDVSTCDPAPVCPPMPAIPALDLLPQWPRLQEILARPDDALDPAELNLVLSQARDPTVDVEATLHRLDTLAAEIRSTLPARCGDRCRIAALDRELFVRRGFHSEFDPSGLYTHIDRDLIDRVLDTHVGYCEGLTYLYLSLGRRLGLPLAAVNARQHLFVRYVGHDGGPFDIDPTQEGRPPLPETVRCDVAPGVYGVAMSPRSLAGQMVGVLAIASGFVSLPWLDLAVSLSPDRPDLHNNRGIERARHGDVQGALQDYATARRLDPCGPLWAMNETRILWRLGQRDEARRMTDAFEQRYVRRELVEGRFFVTLAQANFAFEAGEDDGAEDLVMRALDESDGAPAVLEAMASLRIVQGRRDEAVLAMREALRRDPTVRVRAGLLLALVENGQGEAALTQLVRLAHDEPMPGVLDLHAALVAATLGLDGDAEAAARRCLGRLGEQCARGLVVLGDVARERGRLACARRYYEAFLSCPHVLPNRGYAHAVATVQSRIESLGPTVAATRTEP